MRQLTIAIIALMAAFVAISVVAALGSGCEPSVSIQGMFDAAPDAPECPSPNPGQLPCEDALACPLAPIGSCGQWKCPKNDAGQSYCEWVVKDGG